MSPTGYVRGQSRGPSRWHDRRAQSPPGPCARRGRRREREPRSASKLAVVTSSTAEGRGLRSRAPLELVPQALGHTVDRGQHPSLPVGHCLQLYKRGRTRACGDLDDHHELLADLGNLTFGHHVGADAPARLAREVAFEAGAGRLAHEAERERHALARRHADIRRLAQRHRERLPQRVVEDALPGAVDPVGEHTRCVPAAGAGPSQPGRAPPPAPPWPRAPATPRPKAPPTRVGDGRRRSPGSPRRSPGRMREPPANQPVAVLRDRLDVGGRLRIVAEDAANLDDAVTEAFF